MALQVAEKNYDEQQLVLIGIKENGIVIARKISDYLQEVKSFREMYRRECFQSGIDYVALDTSMPFDRALTEYLTMRRSRA